jgi:hypothetical protein
MLCNPRLSFILRVRGSNPGAGAGDEKEQITFFVSNHVNLLLHLPVCDRFSSGLGLSWLISYLQ